MSEEIVLVEFVDADPMFVLRLDSCMAVLDKPNAQELYARLGEWLGKDKQTGYAVTGVTFPSGCAEPNLPIGTRFMDNTNDRDILLKTGPGQYKWLTKWGMPTNDAVNRDWQFYSETWDLTVIA